MNCQKFKPGKNTLMKYGIVSHLPGDLDMFGRAGNDINP